jgi:hypothetical protein
MTSRSPSSWPEPVNRLFWRRLPAAAGRLSSILRQLLIESRYLLAWPRLAAAVPPGSIALGLLVGLVHPTAVYSGSIAVLAIVLLVGSLGATAGLWFLLGFLPADLVLRPDSWSAGVSKPGLVIADLVLALLLVLIAAATPHLKTQLVLWWSALRSRQRMLRNLSLRSRALEIAGGAGASMLLAWSWLQSVPALIRPVYTWAGSVPDTAAVSPVQENLGLLTVLAGLAGGAVAWLGWVSRQRPDGGGGSTMAYLVDETGPAREPRSYPAWLRYVVMAALGVLIGAGLVSSVVEALLLGVVVALGVYVRQRVSTLASWTRLVGQLPDVVRMAAVIVATVLLGALLLPLVFEESTSLLPVLLLTAVGLLLAAFALPARDRE